MPSYTFDAEMWVPVSVDVVFAFFADTVNLDRMTPPWVHFRTVTPQPIEMRAGLILEHQLRIRGMPIRWKSEISVWQPPTRFVDEQRSGPYKFWTHRHDFAAENGGTWIRDHIDYCPRGWLLAPLVNRWLVAPDLRRVFAHRHQKIREALAPGSSTEFDRVTTG